MNRRLLTGAVVLMAAVAAAQAPAPAHVMTLPADVAWGPAPPSLPRGAEIAVLSGNPAQPGLFTMRARFPAGYRTFPHWHPVAEHITVLEGTYLVGTGDTFDAGALRPVPAGGFVVVPAEMRHFGMTTTGVTFQVHGMGPFVVNYVNPKDDPRNAAAPAR